VGWKVFEHMRDELYKSPLMYTHQRFVPGIWYVDVKEFAPLPYQTGFHIFTTKEAAEDWMEFTCNGVVKRINYTNIVAEGAQGPHKAVVARKIKILCV